MDRIYEKEREVPLMGAYDVIVCGAGPSGVAAALASARTGASTLLIEAQGCLGGVWTAGHLCWIIDSGNKTGILREIINKLDEHNAIFRVFDTSKDFSYDPETMKYLLEEMCIESGVKAQMHTRVVAAVKNDDNRMKYIITESKSGRQAWTAKIFIDATGDGDLAFQAGCGYDYGRENNSETQPMSLQALVTGLDAEEIQEYLINGRHGYEYGAKQKMLKEILDIGINPSYSTPSIIKISDNLYIFSVNHQYGVSAMDAAQITDATIRGRREIFHIANALRSHGGIWRNLTIVSTASYIGVREGRRIHGLYTVSNKDIMEGARHEDAICRVTFCVDVHSTNKDKGKAYSNEGIQVKPYDIPYRALIARDVNGLLMAGRCISGSFHAHASYRVTGNAVPMGQAAGTAAALSAKQDCLPQELPWNKLQSALKESGYIIL